MSTLESIILAVIEGITEFLPISSTGHLIIASSAMGIARDDFTKMFIVCIQFGAILSVVVLYWKNFFRSIEFYVKLFIAFLPAAIIGKLCGDTIDALLENVLAVAVSLLAGGIILLFVDRWFRESETRGMQDVSHFSALKIGLFQLLALVPGISRSAATIIGGLTQNLTRKSAAEFSFFLAVPTMFAASAYKMYEYIHEGGNFSREHVNLFIIGNIAAFIVAMIAIRSFIGFLTKHGFKLFGWYRIALGLTILFLHLLGVELRVV